MRIHIKTKKINYLTNSSQIKNGEKLVFHYSKYILPTTNRFGISDFAAEEGLKDQQVVRAALNKNKFAPLLAISIEGFDCVYPINCFSKYEDTYQNEK